MNLYQRYKRLNFWNKIAFIASVLTIITSIGWLVSLCPRNNRNQIGEWQPLELPKGCSDVIVSFGPRKHAFPVKLIQMSPDKSGANFPLKDLPLNWLQNIEKGSTYSPRERDVLLYDDASITFRGKKISSPFIPYVESNRLFMYVQMPFLSKRQIISMGDISNEKFPYLPRLWDVNANYNSFEIVNENTNPVLQVIYKKPDEVQINGIFPVDTNNAVIAFDGFFTFLSFTNIYGDNYLHVYGTSDESANFILMQNMALKWRTNSFYSMKFPNQRTIFRYPSWNYPGVLKN